MFQAPFIASNLKSLHPNVSFYTKPSYTQTKKTVNAENIPGMCVLTNRARDLVTAESEWVSQSRN